MKLPLWLDSSMVISLTEDPHLSVLSNTEVLKKYRNIFDIELRPGCKCIRLFIGHKLRS